MKTPPSSAAAPPDAAEIESRVSDLHHRLVSVLDRGAAGPSYQLPRKEAGAVRPPVARGFGRFLRDLMGLK